MIDQTSPAENKKRFWSRRRLILLVVMTGFLLRLWSAWQLPVDFDEPPYLEAGYQYARFIQAGDINGLIDYSGTSEHPPLVKLLYGLTYLVLGRGVVWDQVLLLSRLVSVLFGSLAVLVVALIDPLAGGFMAVQTLEVKYTSQAYLEALPLFTSVLALYLLVHASSTRNRWLILSAIALGITGAGKYSYFPILLVILYLLIWEKHERAGKIFIYLSLAGVAFFAFNPYLWHDPIQRLVESLSFHAQYAQGSHVQEIGYPWYQPFLWVSRSFGFIWHPEVFFYLGFDGLIFLLAMPGLWLERKHRRWVLVWIITGLLALLFWPTKWPQYTLVVLPAFCLAASTAVKAGYEKLREQELYWDWFHNMFPRPARRYIVVAASLLGLLIVGALASQVVIAINRIGWYGLKSSTSGLPNDAVNDLWALPDGRMLIGTEGGAAIWKAASGKDVLDDWTVYNPGNSPLPNLDVLAVTQDHEEVFWFGTVTGLASYDGQYWSVYRANDFGLDNEQINAIAVDDQNRIWIGTKNGAAMFDGVAWDAFTAEASGLVDNVVFSIAVQSVETKDVVWFGTLSGLSSYDPSSGEWQSFTREEIDLGWGGVSDLLIDSMGRLWVCTEGGGISLWDGNAWTTLRVSNSHLPYSTIETVAELEPGVFWIAASIPNTAGGVLAKFDGTNWYIYRQGFTGYAGGETLTMAKDKTGRYWFGTRMDGIDLFEPRR
ncbi:MAG: hypothetical protein A2032_07360 [Chloroflexi bacterium RBG_19FT_COMBO_49_13]|nr:MAG: hypothetical protein A2032_07360 [Chloroflexi bacterium RBG_19FT_COMBO_49_13]